MASQARTGHSSSESVYRLLAKAVKEGGPATLPLSSATLQVLSAPFQFRPAPLSQFLHACTRLRTRIPTRARPWLRSRLYVAFLLAQACLRRWRLQFRRSGDQKVTSNWMRNSRAAKKRNRTKPPAKDRAMRSRNLLFAPFCSVCSCMLD